MKLAVNREEIINGLQKAASIIPLKAPSISLRSIWLKAKGNKIAIMATDADVEFTGTYPAQVSEEGLIGVHGRAFADLIARLPNGEIKISLDENSQTLRVEQGRRSYKLPMSTGEWFQEFSQWPDGENALWTGDSFMEMIDKVGFCIDSEEARDAMACLYLKPIESGKIDICGLNGHQFAMYTLANDDLAEKIGEDGLLIQRKFVFDLKKWLAQGELELNLTEKRLFLRQMDGVEVLSIPRYMRNAFPDYHVFLDKVYSQSEGKLSVPRKDAIDVLSRVMVFMSESNRCVYMFLHPDELELTADGADNGSGREKIEASYSGALKRMVFPTKDLMEIFNHFQSGEVVLNFTGQEGPCGITGPEDGNYLVVIMPMRINDLLAGEDEEENTDENQD